MTKHTAKLVGKHFFLTLCLTLFFTNSSFASPIYTASPFSSVDAYGMSPHWDWKTLESEHFQITFSSDLEPIAQRVANLYEEAYRNYVPLFRWQPKEKTQVVLLDNEDTGNGLTSPVLRFGMVLWVTPPDSWLSTNYYDDWLRFLIFHEYTHFINMDTTNGPYALLRPILLDLVLPNSAWPPWMLEGLAVYMETNFTKAGRGRSTYYEMVLRAAVDEKVLNTSQFITLDKVNGTNPYYPEGDTRYQLGYQLMNQVANESLHGKTKDEKDLTPGGKDALGIMSSRSGSRIPTFINGNLQNITGKDWYQTWAEWVKQTEIRMKNDLEKIKSKPTTPIHFLTEKKIEFSNQVTGIAASADGNWLAYNLFSTNKRPGLYLRNMKTQKATHLSDKLYGVGMEFTPDSKSIIYSEYNTLDQYYGLSDLKVYSLEKDKTYSLSNRLRAKDPSISPDGKWVVFTISSPAIVGLARAPLLADSNGEYALGNVEKLISPNIYERISSPKFSKNGTEIYYTFHPHGRSEENLMKFDLKTKSIIPLLEDGNYNRFPTIDPNGELFYVSNATGVDNLYHYRGSKLPSVLVTNMITAINYPCFGFDGKVYGGVFSTAGWDLAEIKLFTDTGSITKVDSQSITVNPPPAPRISDDSIAKTPVQSYKVSKYSVYPSILPRANSPIGEIDGKGVTFGAQTLGFDAIDTHRYTLAATYSTQLKTFDAYGLYSNRTLGPDISFSGGYLTTVEATGPNSVQFYRQLLFSTSVAYPFLSTYSSFTPSIAFNVGRTFYYQYFNNFGTTSIAALPIVPSVDTVFSYSNQETSSLAITSEGGRFAQLGSRYYFLSDAPTWKLFFTDQEFIRLLPHTVLFPSISGQWVSSTASNFALSETNLIGRSSQSIINTMSGDSLNGLAIRGYPGTLHLGKAAVKSALDLRFPISRIFRGLGTELAFLNNFYGIAFAEATYFFESYRAQVLPSTGVGLRLSTELFMIPVTLAGEYHYGFNRALGGTSDLFFNFLVTGFQF